VLVATAGEPAKFITRTICSSRCSAQDGAAPPRPRHRGPRLQAPTHGKQISAPANVSQSPYLRIVDGWTMPAQDPLLDRKRGRHFSFLESISKERSSNIFQQSYFYVEGPRFIRKYVWKKYLGFLKNNIMIFLHA
jgi:hypothetical protein